MNRDDVCRLYVACALVSKRGWTTGQALRESAVLTEAAAARHACLSQQAVHNISQRALRKLAEAVEKDKLLD
jgi:hypothetical protein